MSWEFLLTALIVVVSPGTGVLYTLATGLSRGAKASIVAAFGCTLGIVPLMAAAILGLARGEITIALRHGLVPGPRVRRGRKNCFGLGRGIGETTGFAGACEQFNNDRKSKVNL